MTRRKGDGRPSSGLGVTLPRRDFLVGTAALGLGFLPLAASEAASTPVRPSVRRRVTLGRTGLELPDISMGCFKLTEAREDLVHAALDRGITHFDTADSYKQGSSEKALGTALAGRRAEVTITSKHRATVDESAESQMAALDASLKRLRTDYIDIYLNHAVNELERLQNPEWAEFVTRAKVQGKIRFAGISGHGGRLTRCVDYAVEHGLADVILVAYAFAQDPDFFDELKSELSLRLDMVAPKTDLPEALERARAKGIGVMAMKTLWGAKLNDMRPYEKEGRTYAQSAFRWVLSGRHVDGLVVSMKNTDMMDEYLEASGATRVEARDFSLLRRYHAENATIQCRQGCSACTEVCPNGVAISDVLRSRMYALDYGDLEQGEEAYAALERDASACLDCSGDPCANGCRYGIGISDATRDTHALLGLGSKRV